MSATKTAEAVGESVESCAPDAIGALAANVELGVGSATWGGEEIGCPSSLKVQYDRPATPTSTPTSSAKPFLFLSLI